MAVETNKGGDAPISPAQTLTGVAAAGTGSVPQVGHKRRKRPSSLLAAATSLPSVETSLDEFIARANQTLSDPSEWRAAEENAKQEDEHRREADALRWKAAEQQLREGEAREQSLRRQLDGLQGRLAEAEARAAVATNGTQDGVVADLKVRLTRSEERLYSAEERANHLAQELVAAKAAAAAAPMAPSMTAQFFREGDAMHDDAEERVRIAEAKAAKAIAAARAASAGLTVSPADIAAIESGLVVPSHESAKGTNWLAVFGAFVVGVGIMFGVSKLVLNKDADTTKPAAAAVEPAKTEPVAAPAPAPSKPIVTPIEDDKAKPADTTTPDKNAAAAPAVPEATDKNAAPAAAEEPTIDPTPAKKAAPAKKVAVQKAAPAPHKAAPAAKAAPKAAGGGIADPFATDAPAAKKAPAKQPKQAEKKPAGSIVDPF